MQDNNGTGQNGANRAQEGMSIPLKTLLLTGLAMIAFAANSVIARQALLGTEIGPIFYTNIRLISGAFLLAILVGPAKSWRSGSWLGALYLLAYSALFSLAYVLLPAGIGALILFTAVQMTMIGSGLLRGEKMMPVQIVGAIFAFVGLVFLLNPGPEAPSIWGSALMIGSGIGWGLYSLKGQASQNPKNETSGNFLKAALIAVILALPLLGLNPEAAPRTQGIVLAIVSGAITSGLGYVIWYAALPHLSAVRAGLAQLTVPAIAAAGGIVFLSEPMTARFFIASSVILIGVGVATLSRFEK